MIKLDSKINYKKCAGLSNEIKEILSRYKPENIAEARILPGMTPAYRLNSIEICEEVSGQQRNRYFF